MHVSYNQALALKELKYKGSCIYYTDSTNQSFVYNFESHPDDFISYCGGSVVPAPLKSELNKWFLKTHGLAFCYEPVLNEDYKFDFYIYVETTGEKVKVIRSEFNDEAESLCIDKMIELCKEE